MGLVSDITKRIEVPGDPDNYLDIRMISWLTLDKARRLRQQQLFAQLRELGEIELKVDAGTKVDRLGQFDRYTLLKHGVVGWSYGRELDIEQFDLPTADWAARAVLDYSLPTEQQSKAASSPSTGT